MTENQIKLKGISINYKKFGNERKPIFLVLHGWGGSSDSWIAFSEVLNKEGNYQIFVPDFPNFGKSGSLKKVWEIEDYADLIKEFAERLGIKECFIVAHSFGGRVAIKLASKNNLWIKKLYLCAAAGIKPPLTLKQKSAKLISKLGKYFLKNTSKLSNLQAFFKKYLYKILGEYDYYKCSDEIIRKTFINIINEDLTPLLTKINLPAWIIWGKKDKYTPLKYGELMHKKIKNSKLEIIENVGHGIHLAMGETLAGIIKKSIDQDLNKEKENA